MKWLVLESDSALARRLQDANLNLFGPDVLPVELAHGLRRRVIRGLSDAERARATINDLRFLPIRLTPTTNLLPEAFELALRLNCGVYDSLYVVLARLRDCRCLTADRKLYEATVAAFPETMVFIDQIPQLLA